jgi:methyl-accepting chemotaxis protein
MFKQIDNLSLKNKLLVGFSFPILVIFLISLFVFVNVQRLNYANQWVDHTHKVIAAGKSLLGSMIDMETGMRGFLIAGKDEYLEPYDAGQAFFDNEVVRLQTVVDDNPSQVDQLKKIQQMKADWITHAAQPQIDMPIQVRRGEEAAAEFERISARLVGKQKFDALRVALASIDASMKSQNDIYGELLVLHLLTDMINQETGQRGFLLSGQEQSLEPYVAGQAEFAKHEAQLREYLSTVNYPTATVLEQLSANSSHKCNAHLRSLT